jgi:hypothetical protein
MNGGPSVVVNKKSGFLAAIAKGLFGTIITCVICASALGIYAMRTADHNLAAVRGLIENTVPSLLSSVPDILDRVPELVDSLPSAFGDALHDRRAPDYEPQLGIAVRLESDTSSHHGGKVAVVEVTNNGTEVVSWLTLRLTADDPRKVPVYQNVVQVATPLAMDDDLPGPLWPGHTRRMAYRMGYDKAGETAAAEITELRLWEAPAEPKTDLSAKTE